MTTSRLCSKCQCGVSSGPLNSQNHPYFTDGEAEAGDSFSYPPAGNRLSSFAGTTADLEPLEAETNPPRALDSIAGLVRCSHPENPGEAGACRPEKPRVKWKRGSDSSTGVMRLLGWPGMPTAVSSWSPQSLAGLSIYSLTVVSAHLLIASITGPGVKTNKVWQQMVWAPPIHPPLIHSSICPFTHSSIHPSSHPFICPICPPIIHSSTHRPSTHHSSAYPATHLSIHSSTSSSIHQSNCLFISVLSVYGVQICTCPLDPQRREASTSEPRDTVFSSLRGPRR